MSALGERALGTFLLIGFMIHNTSEGLGIADGTWIGSASTTSSPSSSPSRSGPPSRSWSRSRWIARRAPGGLQTVPAVAGFVGGLTFMWLTGLLVG